MVRLKKHLLLRFPDPPLFSKLIIYLNFYFQTPHVGARNIEKEDTLVAKEHNNAHTIYFEDLYK
jgi:hypothetical protein